MNEELVERAARAALDAFNGDDEAMADALMAAPERTLSAIARAIIPLVLEHAAKACESHMADCLEDKDVQRRWPDIRARNAVYAAAIRAEVQHDAG